MNNRDYFLKFHVIGTENSGKSSLLHRYFSDDFSEMRIPILGYDFNDSHFQIGQKKVTARIYESLAKNPYGNQIPTMYHGAQAIIVVFDLTDEQAFKNIARELYEHKQRYALEDTHVILVGNKSDRVHERKISQAEIDAFKTANQIDAYIPTSAKTGENVKQVFETAAKIIVDRLEQEKSAELPFLTKNVNSEAESSNKEVLKQQLTNYIKEVESHQITDKPAEINFAFGFRFFFVNSRALNRKANYYLAKSLLDKLENGESIATTFHNINQQRKGIITKQGLGKEKDFVDRGINSARLKNIINLAEKYLTNQNSETNPLLGKKTNLIRN